jgi:hypothetical protein
VLSRVMATDGRAALGRRRRSADHPARPDQSTEGSSNVGEDPMDDEDQDLLQKLNRVGNILGDVVAGILENSISRDEQIGFVYWLADAAEAMHARAFRTCGDTVEGKVIEEVTGVNQTGGLLTCTTPSSPQL